MLTFMKIIIALLIAMGLFLCWTAFEGVKVFLIAAFFCFVFIALRNRL